MSHAGAEKICWCQFSQRRKNTHTFRRTQTCFVQGLKGEKEGTSYDTEASSSFEVKGTFRKSPRRGLGEAGAGFLLDFVLFSFTI